MRIIYWKRIAILLLLFCLFTVPTLVSASTQGDAATEIQSGQTQLTNAYQSAVQAEQAGANITELTVTLNTAGSLLSQAEHAYSTADFNAAQNLAVQSQVKLDGFTAQANTLKENASQQRTEDFWIYLVAPILGSIAVVIIGFAVWFSLKRKYAASGEIANGSSTL